MLDKLTKKIANIIVYFRNFKETKPLKSIYYFLAIIVTFFIVCVVATVAAGEGADELEPMIITSKKNTEFTCEIMKTTKVDTTTTTTTLVESTKEHTTTAAPTTKVVATTKRQTATPSAAENGKYLGKFKITVYCACRKCCGKYADNRPVDKNGNPIIYGAHGRVLIPQYSIATDPKVIPSGKEVVIDGRVYRADDTGGAVKGNVIDIYCGTDHAEALKIASQYSKYEEVYWK